jgi:hypothetical protein
VKVVVEFQEIEAGDWGLCHIDLEFLCLEDPFTRASFPCFDKFIDDPFGFAENLEVRRLIKMRR